MALSQQISRTHRFSRKLASSRHICKARIPVIWPKVLARNTEIVRCHGIYPESPWFAICGNFQQSNCVGGGFPVIHTRVLLPFGSIRRLTTLHRCYSWRDCIAHPIETPNHHESKAYGVDDGEWAAGKYPPNAGNNEGILLRMCQGWNITSSIISFPLHLCLSGL